MSSANNKIAMVAILFLSVVVIAAVVALTIWSPNNGGQAIGLILGFTAPTVAALLAFAKAAETGAKQDSLSVAVNGRLTQLLETNGQAQRAAGVVQGHAAGLLQASGEIHPAAAIAPLIIGGAAAAAAVESARSGGI